MLLENLLNRNKKRRDDDDDDAVVSVDDVIKNEGMEFLFHKRTQFECHEST